MGRAMATDSSMKEPEVEVKPLPGGKSRVKVSLGITITLAFQSMRIDVGYEHECKSTQVDDVTNTLLGRCKDWLNEEQDGTMDMLEDMAAEAETRKRKLGVR